MMFSSSCSKEKLLERLSTSSGCTFSHRHKMVVRMLYLRGLIHLCGFPERDCLYVPRILFVGRSGELVIFFVIFLATGYWPLLSLYKLKLLLFLLHYSGCFIFWLQVFKKSLIFQVFDRAIFNLKNYY